MKGVRGLRALRFERLEMREHDLGVGNQRGISGGQAEHTARKLEPLAPYQVGAPELQVTTDDARADLEIIGGAAVVQVGRADGHPYVVDDHLLGVDVDIASAPVPGVKHSCPRLHSRVWRGHVCGDLAAMREAENVVQLARAHGRRGVATAME